MGTTNVHPNLCCRGWRYQDFWFYKKTLEFYRCTSKTRCICEALMSQQGQLGSNRQGQSLCHLKELFQMNICIQNVCGPNINSVNLMFKVTCKVIKVNRHQYRQTGGHVDRWTAIKQYAPDHFTLWTYNSQVQTSSYHKVPFGKYCSKFLFSFCYSNRVNTFLAIQRSGYSSSWACTLQTSLKSQSIWCLYASFTWLNLHT